MAEELSGSDPRPNIYDIDPGLFQRLGMIVTGWAWIEESLGHLLAHLLDADRGSMFAVTQSVSGATMTEWIKTLATIKNVESGEAGAITTVLKEADQLRLERNALVHGLWRRGPSQTTALVHTARLTRTEIMMDQLVTQSDLDDLIQAVTKLSMQFTRIGRYFGYLPA